MKSRLPRRSKVLAVLALAAVTACAPLPVQEVDLAKTTWTVDVEPVSSGSPLTVAFHDLDSATVASACETFSVGLVMETDSNGMGFTEPLTRTPIPCDEATKEEDRALVNAMLSTETWRVIDEQTIELTGSRVLLLKRVDGS